MSTLDEHQNDEYQNLVYDPDENHDCDRFQYRHVIVREEIHDIEKLADRIIDNSCELCPWKDD